MPGEIQSPAKAAGAALAAKRGGMKTSELQGASKSTVKTMSEKELHDLASTKRKGKPEHVSKSHRTSRLAIIECGERSR